MEIRIPLAKIYELSGKLIHVLWKSLLRFFQSLVGSSNFCARAIPILRAFCSQILAAMSKASKPGHFIRITCPLKEDFRTILGFLQKFNGSCYFPESFGISDNKLQLFVDASENAKLGCAVYLQQTGHIFSGLFHGKTKGS